MSIMDTIRTRRAQRQRAARRINNQCSRDDQANPGRLDRLEALARIDYSDEAITERLLALIHEDARATAQRDQWMRQVDEDLWMY